MSGSLYIRVIQVSGSLYIRVIQVSGSLYIRVIQVSGSLYIRVIQVSGSLYIRVIQVSGSLYIRVTYVLYRYIYRLPDTYITCMYRLFTCLPKMSVAYNYVHEQNTDLRLLQICVLLGITAIIFCLFYNLFAVICSCF